MPKTINTAIEDVPLSRLKFHPRNANQGDFGAIQQSVEANGFYGTIVANKRTGHILAGNHRYAVAKQMGFEKVPVSWVDVDDEQELRILIADNRTTRLGIDNEAQLAELLSELAATPAGLLGTGFDGDDLDDLIGKLAGETKELLGDPDEVPEPPVDPITKPGDLWLLGKHRLLCGDSTKLDDVDRLMNKERADLLLTDPPYNVDYTGGTKDALKLANDNMKDEEFRKFLVNCFGATFGWMKPGASFYIWHADSEGFNFRGAVKDCGQQVRQCLIWAKNVLVMGRQDYQWQHEPCLYGWKEGAAHGWYSDRKQTTLLHFEKPRRNEEHPTMKPVALFAYLMGNSTAPQGLVYDPFLGSGTTLIAAEQLGRKCYGMEISPQYCDVIVKRWETLTGQKAVLEADNAETE